MTAPHPTTRVRTAENAVHITTTNQPGGRYLHAQTHALGDVLISADCEGVSVTLHLTRPEVAALAEWLSQILATELDIDGIPVTAEVPA